VKGKEMADLIRVVSVPKFSEDGKKEVEVFKGTLEQLYYRFGPRIHNPLVGYVSRKIHYTYRFYRWQRNFGWVPIEDPRSEK
jgi:hypothetical protein